MSNVDKYKVISNRLNDELIEIDKQLFNIKQQLDEVNQQRNKKLEEISFNNLSIQNIMHHKNPSHIILQEKYNLKTVQSIY